MSVDRAAVVIAQGEEVTRDLPAPAWVFGLIALVVLVSLLMALLAFGKGRDHT